MRARLAPGDDGLAVLQRRFETFAARHGLPASTRRDAHLAIDEIVSNIVRHAAPRHPDVRVNARVTGPALEIAITDDGEAFDVVAHPDPDVTAPVTERPVGGLGIYLVKRLMNDVQYGRRRGRNRLVLRRTIR
jgi:serine/threonine-protein kinase RsbW